MMLNVSETDFNTVKEYVEERARQLWYNKNNLLKFKKYKMNTALAKCEGDIKKLKILLSIHGVKDAALMKIIEENEAEWEGWHLWCDAMANEDAE